MKTNRNVSIFVHKIMTANELHRLLASPNPPVLIDVLPEDVFECRRIPGAVNACVYEIAFSDKVRELVPGFSTPILVYGAGADGMEAKVAGERLVEHGYANVKVFPGGLEEWRAADLPVEGTGDSTDANADGVFIVDPVASVIRWTGRNLFNHHSGTLRLAGGRIEVCAARLIAASFEIDMSTIECEDIPDDSMRGVLVRHLMHSDFFDVENHPVAEFEATSANAISGATEGTPNYEIAGNFTMLGIRHPLRFPALIAASPDGSGITAQAQVEVDRTGFGCIYGSGKFFRHLGQHLVNDHFQVHLKIRAVREA